MQLFGLVKAGTLRSESNKKGSVPEGSQEKIRATKNFVGSLCAEEGIVGGTDSSYCICRSAKRFGTYSAVSHTLKAQR